MSNAIRSILLVDDDLDDQDFFKEAVKVADGSIMVSTAKNGIDALQKLEYILPDIILLDLNMPQMNGVECLQELKASPQHRNIPVIIYSSFISTSDRAEVIALGVERFIRKPISFSETVKTIRELVTDNMNEYKGLLLPDMFGTNQTIKDRRTL